MLRSDNQLIGKQSYSNGGTVIMEKRIEQAKASAESAVSEKQASKGCTNDIAVILGTLHDMQHLFHSLDDCNVSVPLKYGLS